jgi:REP element-mobilizing transposase RayT
MSLPRSPAAARQHPKRPRHASGQLKLSMNTWGGRRKGAGRPRKEGSGPQHRSRCPVASRHPIHLCLMIEKALPSLRRPKARSVLESCFRDGKEREGFRLIHFSIQHHHLHLIAEAKSALSLSRAARGLSIRIARHLNRLWDRKGRVFAERYFARPLKTPREVRNALRYVLLNGAKHDAARGVVLAGGLDPYSSAPTFDGFRGFDPGALSEAKLPVAQARTYLLRRGWRVHGLISLSEVPGLGP